MKQKVKRHERYATNMSKTKQEGSCIPEERSETDIESNNIV